MKIETLKKANALEKRIKRLTEGVSQSYVDTEDLTEHEAVAWTELNARQDAERKEVLQGMLAAAQAELEAL